MIGFNIRGVAHLYPNVKDLRRAANAKKIAYKLSHVGSNISLKSSAYVWSLCFYFPNFICVFDRRPPHLYETPGNS